MDQDALVVGDTVQWTDPDNAEYEGRYHIAHIVPAEFDEDGEICYTLIDDQANSYFVNESELG
jgi:hypothetical protein